ncbi:aromatic amino acid DMT transporter YddG [Colwellia sp. C1TZA3]|uniref:aromatic amino acid DMT transporter YddG n=1 Tax=Colwellia sp. C1TZA3 TaxID=2508879 RepID=UPI0011B98243|nr:aromatic amino acid DMT transporter YddG [Colwellia sp. C1TZA3]TWX71367.1 drug/metabolite DMT transporter permease [Colwellia sp. C1TZA3]
MVFLTQHKYTLYGVAAILLWSFLVALVRDVSEIFSPIGGAAMMYSVSAIFLILVMGVPKLKDFPPRYLIVGTILFVAYEVCLALSLGMANDRHQAMEMAVINYLWPALTILLTVILGRKKVSFWLYPSVLIAFIGVAWCITGDSEVSPAVLMNNFSDNPVTYLMAFSAAFIWAIYCVVTQRLSNGKNAISLFFTATAITLWFQYALSDEAALTFSLSSTLTLLLAGIVVGSGYALWNKAIIGGNLVLLGTMSYFTPVFSTVISSVYLSITLSPSFWQGVVLVTLGSLICYFVTKEKPQKYSTLKST